MQWLAWSAGIVFSAFLGVVFTVLLQDQVSDMVARILRVIASPNRGRRISGEWFTYWGIVSEPGSSSSAARPSTEVASIRLRRVGERVIGSDRAKGNEYVISATLQAGQFLTGTWHDSSNGRYQWGGFQLCWGDDGSGMVGKFVGKDSQNHINHGIWLWARNVEDLPRLADWAATSGGYQFESALFIRALNSALEDISIASK